MGLVKPKSVSEADASSPLPEGIATLDAADSGERRRAVRALASMGGNEAILIRHLAGETAASVRAAILTTLVEHKSPEIARALTLLLEEEDSSLRSAVIEALQAMPEEFLPCVEDLLAHDDSDVRIFAVNIIASTAHEKAPDWLIGVIETDPHVNVCAAAVDGLTEVGGEDALVSLELLAERFADKPFIVFATETAIRRIRGH